MFGKHTHTHTHTHTAKTRFTVPSLIILWDFAVHVWWNRYLFEDDSMTVELLGSVGHILDLAGDGETKGPQLPHLPQQCHQPLAVVDSHLAILMVQFHQAAVRLQAGIIWGNTKIITSVPFCSFAMAQSENHYTNVDLFLCRVTTSSLLESIRSGHEDKFESQVRMTPKYNRGASWLCYLFLQNKNQQTKQHRSPFHSSPHSTLTWEAVCGHQWVPESRGTTHQTGHDGSSAAHPSGLPHLCWTSQTLRGPLAEPQQSPVSHQSVGVKKEEDEIRTVQFNGTWS